MRNKEYLLAVKTYLVRNYSSEVISIVLFGSMVENENTSTNSTDVDLLVVIKDSCSVSLFHKIYRELITIEVLYLPKKDSFVDFFKKGLQRATGMFINLFFCRYSDLTSENFTNVFGVNPVMAYLFAPKTSVWISLKQRYSIIWGEDVFDKSMINYRIQFSDILRSFVMNFLLSLAAISFSLITRSMSQYAMEAVKWSLFTWKNVLNYPNTSLITLCNRYARNASPYEKRLLSAFLMFRRTRKPNNFLLLFAPLFIFRLHRKLIQNMRVAV